MTSCDSQKGTNPVELIRVLTQDRRSLTSVTRVLQMLADLQERGFTGEVTLDVADGLVRGCQTRVVQRWKL